MMSNINMASEREFVCLDLMKTGGSKQGKFGTGMDYEYTHTLCMEYCLYVRNCENGDCVKL
jgi:hypothetical protein